MVRRAAWIACLALVVAGGVAAGVAWRLAHGMVDLGFLVPRVERALARADGSFAVHIGSAGLSWDRRDRRLVLAARDVRVVGAGGVAAASVPAVLLVPNLRALLRGAFVPQTVDLLAPRLHVRRAPAGGVDLGLGQSGGADPAAALQRLLAPAGAGASLRRVAVRDGEIVTDDEPTWSATAVQVTVERREEKLAATLGARLRVGAGDVPVDAALSLPASGPGGTATIRFDALDLAAAAPLAPAALRPLLARLAVALAGSAQVDVGAHLLPQRVALHATGAGAVAVPELPAREVRLDGLALTAALDVPADTVTLTELSATAAGAALALDGGLAELHGARRLALRARVAHLPTGDLAGWWPTTAAPGPRAWFLDRVAGGMVRSVAVTATGRLEGDRLVAPAVAGTVAFDGLHVRPLDVLPPVTDVAGDGTFTADRWAFRVARGAVGGLAIAHGTVDLDVAGGRAAVDAAVSGPLAAAVALAQRLVPGAAGVPADGLGGTMTADVRVTVPLAPARGRGELPVTVSAVVHDAAMPRVVRGWSFSDGTLDVGLHGAALDVTGRGRLEGAPVDVVWREALAPARPSRHVEVSGRLGAAERAALGLDPGAWLGGPVTVRARLDDDGAAGTLQATADLTDATVTTSLLASPKPAGSPGSATARVRLVRGTPTAIEAFHAAAGGATLDGHATLVGGSRLGALDLAAAIAARDARHPAGHATLALRPAAAGHSVRIGSDDAGAFFRACGASEDATGGRLSFTGNVDLAGPGTPLDGRLELHEFTLLRSSWLTRVTTLASLAGVASLLEGRGIRFERLDAGLASRGRTITITDALARGPSLDVLVNGTIDRVDGTSALHGTLVPSYYGVNTGVGRLPLVGPLLTGGEGGVQAFDFDVRGPLASPTVTVNPLSSLAPGVLRDLLRGVSGTLR